MAEKPIISILMVEDDSEFREMACEWMSRKGHQVEQAANGQEALLQVQRKHFHVAIFDMNMPGISGLELIGRFQELDIDSEIIILTGQSTVENAVATMKRGAFDYLTKPFPLSELENRCVAAYEHGQLVRENVQLKTILKRQVPFTKIIGSSAAMKDVARLIERVAPTNKAVLIQGESGTGKELVARAVQQLSTRADKPFVTINCAALPEQLIESELFGHEKGSFTGATARKDGLFEVADGGTLFVDEIGELSLALQPKLLRVLEDGSLRRVGSLQERRVDVRVIAATNRDLLKEVEAGRFREDLYYRINVMSLRIPPLRERNGDVAELIDQFLNGDWKVDESARRAMLTYDWPGNVRQLINALDRATILAENNLITLDDLPLEVTSSGKTESPVYHHSPLESDLASLERSHIIAVLNDHDGNKAQAARALGIHRRKLYRLLERYQINDEIKK